MHRDGTRVPSLALGIAPDTEVTRGRFRVFSSVVDTRKTWTPRKVIRWRQRYRTSR
jgi:hypothetical protein